MTALPREKDELKVRAGVGIMRAFCYTLMVAGALANAVPSGYALRPQVDSPGFTDDDLVGGVLLRPAFLAPRRKAHGARREDTAQRPHIREGGRFTRIAGPLNAIAEALESKRIDSRHVFRAVGIHRPISNDPMDRLTLSTTARLYAKCVEITNDPYFGLTVAKFIRSSNIHALGTALLASNTLTDFFLRLERYLALVTQGVTLRVERTPHEATLRFHHPEQTFPGEAEDAFLGFILYLIRRVFRLELAPTRVEFHHRCPEEGPGPYQRYFGVLPKFEQAESVMSFPVGVMDKTLAGASPELTQFNDKIVGDYVARLDKTNVAGRARAKIIELMSSGDCSRRKVASDIGMSENTLNLKLARHQTSFHELLNEVRKELALGYLTQRTLSITEITFLLGFHDVSNFTRAFKRWTGTSPTLYRSRMLEGQS